MRDVAGSRTTTNQIEYVNEFCWLLEASEIYFHSFTLETGNRTNGIIFN